jgi:ubiquinone/menaquinone biosynthesis C-methylase UbiE
MARKDTYTHGHQSVVVSQHARRTAEDCARFARHVIAPNSRILDVGCGPASITVGLARWVPGGSVTAIEPGGDILDTAREAVAAAGAENVSVEEASVYELPYDDDTFDVAYAHQVLQHLADPVGALREMRRVTRPGGHVAVRDADYYTMSCSPESVLIDRWRDVYHRVARHNGAEPDAGRHLYRWCRDAGLPDVVMTASVWNHYEPEDRMNWGNSWAQRCLESSFGQQAIEYGYATRAEMEEIAAGWRQWASDPDGYFHFIHGEALAEVMGEEADDR